MVRNFRIEGRFLPHVLVLNPGTYGQRHEVHLVGRTDFELAL